MAYYAVAGVAAVTATSACISCVTYRNERRQRRRVHELDELRSRDLDTVAEAVTTEAGIEEGAAENERQSWRPRGIFVREVAAEINLRMGSIIPDDRANRLAALRIAQEEIQKRIRTDKQHLRKTHAPSVATWAVEMALVPSLDAIEASDFSRSMAVTKRRRRAMYGGTWYEWIRDWWHPAVAGEDF